jgi:hypothetical protein
MAIHYPPIFINKYLSEKISGTRDTDGYLNEYFSQPMKFFPTSPTDINALTESFPEASNDVFAVYDRMFKMRRTPFPHIKCEQLLYYFYKMSGNLEALIETTQLVSDLLDNGDESAQELNNWIASKVSGTVQIKNPVSGVVEEFDKATFDGTDFLLPRFHYIKIFQLEETRDIIDFGTARTYAGNKVIIDYDWHRDTPKVNKIRKTD